MLYQKCDIEGTIREIVADEHMDEYEFVSMCRERFNVEIQAGTVKLVWSVVKITNEKIPVTKGLVKWTS